MESSGKFERLFFKILREQNIAGAGGALGTGSGFDPGAGEIGSSDWYAPGDARNPTPTGKVQTRKGTAGSKKKKNKSKRKNLFLTGEDEEGKADEPKGLATSWEDGDLKVTIKEVLEYLDDNDVPVKDVSTDKLKSILIADDRDEKRVQAADLKYPVVVVVDKNGKYKSILDGNHRVDKAISNDIPTVKTRELDLRTAPKEYKKLFNYEIETEEDAEDVHKPVKPGILKKRLGELSCSKVRGAKGKLKDKGTHYAKALQRYLNYHC
jgi:hypothetical protein